MSGEEDELFDELGEELEEDTEADVVEAEVVDEGGGDIQTADQSSGGPIELAVEDLERLSETYELYEQVKTDLLTGDDRQKVGQNHFIKKSGWRKIATAFNVSVDITQKRREIRDGIITWEVTAKAVAPNGKSMVSTGSCASNESNHMEYVADDRQALEAKNEYSIDDPDVMKVEGKWRRLKDPRAVKEHDIMATAETRAKNRAISDLVGGGEVSAEELSIEDQIG